MFAILNNIIALNKKEEKAKYVETVKTNNIAEIFSSFYDKKVYETTYITTEDYEGLLISFYKSLFPNISENTIFELYRISLVDMDKDKMITGYSYDEFIKKCSTIKPQDISMWYNKIFHLLPIEFFISTYLNGVHDIVITEKIKDYIFEYVVGLYTQIKTIQNIKQQLNINSNITVKNNSLKDIKDYIECIIEIVPKTTKDFLTIIRDNFQTELSPILTADANNGNLYIADFKAALMSEGGIYEYSTNEYLISYIYSKKPSELKLKDIYGFSN